MSKGIQFIAFCTIILTSIGVVHSVIKVLKAFKRTNEHNVLSTNNSKAFTWIDLVFGLLKHIFLNRNGFYYLISAVLISAIFRLVFIQFKNNDSAEITVNNVENNNIKFLSNNSFENEVKNLNTKYLQNRKPQTIIVQGCYRKTKMHDFRKIRVQ